MSAPERLFEKLDKLYKEAGGSAGGGSEFTSNKTPTGFVISRTPSEIDVSDEQGKAVISVFAYEPERGRERRWHADVQNNGEILRVTSWLKEGGDNQENHPSIFPTIGDVLRVIRLTLGEIKTDGGSMPALFRLTQCDLKDFFMGGNQ